VINSFWRRLEFGLKVIMAIFLFVMMALTAADVVCRYFFNAPISGAFEIVQYLMAIVVFTGLPVTTASDGHLAVSLIPRTMSGRIGRMHRIFVRLLSSVALLLIAWRMTVQAQILDGSQAISGYLQVPLAPIAGVMAFFAFLAFLIIAAKLAAALFAHDDGPHDSAAVDRGYE
jgi:TRAP-type C4-dicarboxylate transport system permease small subunit